MIRVLFNVDRRIEYGEKDNFKFLIKWNSKDTSSATWED